MGRDKPHHPWVRPVRLARVPGPASPLLDRFVEDLARAFEQRGHTVLDAPDETIDAFLTTARFGEPLDWRESLLFTGRKRFGLATKPVLFTVVAITPRELRALLARFESLLARPAPDPADYRFGGLAPNAHAVLFEQGKRGGPMMSIARLVQGQYKTLRAVLLVGEREPEEAYVIDLAGSHARCEGRDARELADDVALRIATALSTREISEHRTEAELIPRALWRTLETPAAMLAASRAFGARNFFTTLVHIADLVIAPRLTDAVARQYSEGCFATWDPTLGALVTTVTGSRNPVEKGAITEDDLAVVTGVAPGKLGAVARHVEGLRNDPPSSEAVELEALDHLLPWIELGPEWKTAARVPIVRSKLHGHRGIASFDPTRVEYVALDAAFHHYPVSCATEAQAEGVCAAFARAAALRATSDARDLAFTILPGHGLLLVERWVHGKRPFELLIEAIDSRAVEIENEVPQGPLHYERARDGRMVLKRGATAPESAPTPHRSAHRIESAATRAAE